MKISKKNVLFVIVDILIANLATLLSLFIKFLDSPIGLADNLEDYLFGYLASIPILTLVLMIFFMAFGIYRTIWKYARSFDAVKFSVVTAIVFLLSMGLHIAIAELFGASLGIRRLPIDTYILGGMISLVLMLGERLVIRLMSRSENNKSIDSANHRIMIIGGGAAGNMLLQDLLINPAFSDCMAVCIIDDNPSKLGMEIYGVRVVGDRDTIIANAEKYNINEILFAIPNCSAADRADILNICTKTGCFVKTVPSLDMMLEANINMATLRQVNVNDLLGRDPISVDIDSIAGYIEGETVLITGGGGSIGSELCRQVAKHSPKQLIIFDIYENNAYDILNELKTNHKELNVTALIGSVRDTARLDEIFKKYRPKIVYHAAAHKHVPLMEDSPKEAIKNNVFGTLNVVRAADKYEVKRFVMISTDKAVNPTNVMGATKRICEMIVQNQNKHSKTEFMAVRFGNVLGSNGSVIPLFEKQIAAGGPVTVTDKRIVRYFMTIPEAVSLVLQAGAFGRGGEIFVLDMGKPMKIVDLAENLIKLSGYVPYKDIDIKFVGLRPGEKLYEELLMKEEGLKQTANKLIFIGKQIDIDDEVLYSGLDRLADAVANDKDIREAVKSVVDTYKPEACK